jgi:hypothetical protein
VVRKVFARRFLETRGSKVIAPTGALGISNSTWVAPGSNLRTATSIPPALTFKAVANSRNSLPLSSWLRTKTGMAKGNLAHFRRSAPILGVLIQSSPKWASGSSKHLSGQNLAKASARGRRKPESAAASTPKPAVPPDIALTGIALPVDETDRRPAHDSPAKVKGFATLG